MASDRQQRIVGGSQASLARALGFALLGCCGSAAMAQTLDPSLWAPNGPVNAVAWHGGVVYLGGHFSRVGPVTGGGALLNPYSGALIAPISKVDGAVYATADDGAGGWYIGGAFTSVGGFARSNLAHILADATIAPWNPSADGAVRALAVSGGRVFVGGSFSSVDGQARRLAAAVDASTGVLLPWNASAVGSAVRTLAIKGNTIYLGGNFSSMGGQPRANIAALDTGTALATDWVGDTGIASTVYAIVVDPFVLTIYAGGSFDSIGGQPRAALAALDAVTGNATSWHPVLSGQVHALLLRGSVLYAGGAYSAGSAAGLGDFDVNTGRLGWGTQVSGEVDALAWHGTALYVGGGFGAIGGQSRDNLAAIDGGVTSWDPGAGNVAGAGSVYALAENAAGLYAGGDFTSIGGVKRGNVAALDATTGAATLWNPVSDGDVETLVASGRTIYVAGGFTNIGSVKRNYVAALDSASGGALLWNPNPNSVVRSLAVGDGVVYAAGDFTNIGGALRRYLAALDSTGAATSWNPNPNGSLESVAVDPGTLYASGHFSAIGGQSRLHMAALYSLTGGATPWTPAETAASSMLIAGGPLFAGNSDFLGAIDATSGATLWSNGSGTPLACGGAVVYAGGHFQGPDGRTLGPVAALDVATGAARAWAPNPDAEVAAAAVSGSAVYLGGAFLRICGELQPYLASVSLESPTSNASGDATRRGLLLLPVVPNPARGTARVRIVLPEGGRASLAIYDLAGRRILSLLDHGLETAGEHDLTIPTASLPPGVFLCRLQFGRMTAVRKLLIMR